MCTSDGHQRERCVQRDDARRAMNTGEEQCWGLSRGRVRGLGEVTFGEKRGVDLLSWGLSAQRHFTTEAPGNPEDVKAIELQSTP